MLSLNTEHVGDHRLFGVGDVTGGPQLCAIDRRKRKEEKEGRKLSADPKNDLLEGSVDLPMVRDTFPPISVSFLCLFMYRAVCRK